MALSNRMFCVLSNTNPFDLLQDTGLSENAPLRNNAASAYNLLLVIGIIGLFTTLIICGIRLAFSNNSTKKSEVKASIGFKAWIAIGFFGFVTLIGIVYKITLSLV